MIVSEIYRNLLSNFQLVFPLTMGGETIPGKASEIDANTVLMYYRNTSNNWVTTTYSGSPVEIGSLGIYTITILSSWFTNRDDTYPIVVAIIDDTGIKTWDDRILVINPQLELEKLKVQNSNPYEASAVFYGFEANATTGMPAISLNSWTTKSCIYAEADTAHCAQFVSNGGRAVYLGGETKGLYIYSNNGEGIHVESWGGQAILLDSNSTEATFEIDNWSTGQHLKCNEIDGIKAITDNLTVKKNTAFNNFPIFMVDSRDKISGMPGLTISATRCIDDGTFAPCTNSPVEIAFGCYRIDLSASDLNGGSIILRFTADGAFPRTITILTVP